MKKFIFGLTMAMLCMTTTTSQSAWHYDGYAYTSNFCRNGVYWQFVPWNLTGTDCYMPMHGLWGKRVAE